VRGDFRDATNTDHPGAVRATVKGDLSGPRVNARIQNHARPEISNLQGRGGFDVTAIGQTVGLPGPGNGTITGHINGVTRLRPVRGSVKVGDNYVDGQGTFESMLTGAIETPGTEWDLHAQKIVATLPHQKIFDGVGNKLQAFSVDVESANVLAAAPGVPVTGTTRNLYWKGTKKTIKQQGRIRNLVADLTPPTRSAAKFEPHTLKAIVEHADLASRVLTYEDEGGGDVEQMRLLSPSVMVEGTLADLKAAGLVDPALTTLSSLTLEVTNVRLNDASAAPDADTIPPVVAGTYKMMVKGHWYEFTLASLAVNPPQTKFKALMYLKKTPAAAYEVFTAHPVP
jgi:hypothetical protein